MVLVRLQQVELAFGDHVLLDKVDLDVQSGERLCVVGRNGEGKSTLLKIINREIIPDDGAVQYRDTLRVAALQQELPKSVDESVYDVVADGIGDLGAVLARYHEETARGADADLDERVPVLDQEFRGTVDLASAILSLSLGTEAGRGCMDRVPVFDGGIRYDVLAERIGVEQVRQFGCAGYELDALNCRVSVERNSGLKKNMDHDGSAGHRRSITV